MAYRPPRELKGRIENIRKKFEASSEPFTVLNSRPLTKPQSNNTDSCSRNAKTSYPLDDPDKEQKNNICLRDDAYCGTPAMGSKYRYARQESIPPTKGNIRRTPAFRCDKNFRGRGTSRSVKRDNVFFDSKIKIFEAGREEKSGRKFNVLVKEQSLPEMSSDRFKNELVSVSTRTDDNSVTCNIKRNDVKNLETPNRQLQVLSRDSSNSLGRQFEPTKYAGTKLVKVDTEISSSHNESISKQNTELNKNLSDTESTDTSCECPVHQELQESATSKFSKSSEIPDFSFQQNVKSLSDEIAENKFVDLQKPVVECRNELTNSIKAALKAPLPLGPPPKKPPRTFAHSPATKSKVQECINQLHDKHNIACELVAIKPQRSRTEPRLMLKKLEEALMAQQQRGIAVITPRTPLVERKNIEKPPVKVPLPSPPHTAESETSLLTNCLNSLNCATNTNLLYSQTHLYEKPSERSSKFFVDISSSHSKLFIDHKQYGTIKKSYSEEHIYAEPFSCDKSELLDFEENLKSLGPSSRQQKMLVKTLSASVEHLNSPSQPVFNDNSCNTLHYMCSPIKTDGPSVKPETVSKHTATNNSCQRSPHEQHHSITQKGVAEKNSPGRRDETLLKKPDSNGTSRRLPLLHISRSGSTETDATFRLIDRSKIQLVMNQAFGSPLQGVPGAEDEATTDLFDNDISSPDTDENVKVKEEDRANWNIAGAEDSQSEGSTPDLTRLTEERKVYVRRVSSRVFQTKRPSSVTGRCFPHLFHCVLLIGLNLDCERKVKVPYIKSKYPPQAEVPPLLEYLCFPDAAEWPPPPAPRGEQQMYSLVITAEDGRRTFGYCCRVMPEGAPICLPLAYCIVSPHRARGFYYKVLHELESRHGQPEWLQAAFVKELYCCEFPAPGQSLKCHTTGKPTDTGLVQSVAAVLRRPVDSRLEERDLSRLLTSLPVALVLQVFATLLLERKVLFLSISLSKLSSCIEALESILYPFSWQYTFIPVLPSSKLEVCEAPTPYIIGVLKGKDGTVPSVNVDEGLLVDIDESRVCHNMGDESSILPSRMRRCLKMALQLAASQDCEDSRSVLVSEAFLRMFVEVCGHYKTHIVTQQDGKRVFERESFIKAVPSRSVQLFLEWFTETAMFSVFINARIEQSMDSGGIFEQRVSEHHEEMEKNTMLFLKNYKALNKKVKTLGDRLKDWTPFS